jgi:hypothetical protein
MTTYDEDDPEGALFGASEDPLDVALGELSLRGGPLGAALKRAIPFLFRDGVAVAAAPAVSVDRAAFEAELGSPRHVVTLCTEPEGYAALLLDAPAVAFLLDGALGGNGANPPALAAEGITGPQKALLGRILATVVPAFSAALEAGLGLKLKRPTPGDDHGPPDTVAALRFRLGEEGVGGSISLTLAPAALLAGSAPGKKAAAGGFDPVLGAALGNCELELVAELGRVKLTLHQLAGLQVGDVLDLPTPVGSAIPVRVDGRVLFRGHPITSGSHVAVRVAPGTRLESSAGAPSQGDTSP